MENASKALLIAAAVLIAILLIAFGMNIFNSTKGTGDSLKQTMSATEIATFNNKFTAYAGTRSLAQVKALANIVIANNATNETKSVTFVIVTAEKSTPEDITSAVAKLNNNTHTVDFEYEEGLITKVIIDKP